MIKTLSIPIELEDFLRDNPDLSPSKMLQSKIIEIKNNRSIIFKEVNDLKLQVKFLQEKLMDSGDEIDFLQKKTKKIQGKDIPLDDGKNDKLI